MIEKQKILASLFDRTKQSEEAKKEMPPPLINVNNSVNIQICPHPKKRSLTKTSVAPTDTVKRKKGMESGTSTFLSEILMKSLNGAGNNSRREDEPFMRHPNSVIADEAKVPFTDLSSIQQDDYYQEL